MDDVARRVSGTNVSTGHECLASRLLNRNSVTVVNECQEAFGFDTVLRQIMKRKIMFLVKICNKNNSIGAAVAIKYAVDDLEILKRLM